MASPPEHVLIDVSRGDITEVTSTVLSDVAF